MGNINDSEDILLKREYQDPVDLGPMVTVILGQAGVIQENAAGENEVYFHTNGLPGKFYALDAETGEVKFTEVIPNTEALWAMKVGSDKNVYFSGTSDKKFYRYIPTERRIECLGLNPADSWVGDLEATLDGKIYGGTYAADQTGGKVFEYDIETKTFNNYGTIKAGQDYAVGLGGDDQYIYAGLGTNIHLFKIDRMTGKKTEIIIPQNESGFSTGEVGTISDLSVVDRKLFISVNANHAIVLDRDTHKILNLFKFSNMISKPSPYDPNLVYYEYETKLYQYDMKTDRAKEVPLNVPLPPTVRLKDMQWIQIKNGEKAGRTILAMLTQYGDCVFYDPIDHGVSLIKLQITPDAVRIQSMKRGMDGRIYLGGYQRGMSVYNPFTGQIDVNISSFPQPENIGFLNNKVYYGTYVSAVMYQFDPRMSEVPNKNPKKVYKIKNQQDRPFAIISGENKLFVGTVPDYGLLGGSLAIYDEETDVWSQYDHIVKDQSIASLAYKDGFLYGSTTIWGGLGIEPTASEAKMFIWDVQTNTKLEEFTLDIPAIDIPPKMIGDLSFGPDGLLWGVVEGTIFAMDIGTKEIVKSKMIFPSLYNTSKWNCHDLVWSLDGMIYTTLGRKVMVIDPETLQHKMIVDCSISHMELGIDGSIYYGPASGRRLSRIAIPETDATLSGIYLNGVLLEDFSPGKLQYYVEAHEGKNITMTTTQEGATATVMQQDSLDQSTIIQVLALDGKSKLEYRINNNK
ncbi:MAG: PQQ-like beta-propeller repeat protein [Epulopiscium sp.]|nr:PQQ-like beta-propeller repeat protein [Candidatus Epulonipiscium sp.]